MKSELIDIIKTCAVDQGVPPLVMAAIVMQESAGNQYALRFEPAWKLYQSPEVFAKKLGQSLDTEKSAQAHSYGLCQIMGAVAREHAFDGYWGQLYDADLNMTIGCLHFKKFLKRHGGNEVDAISCYNAGSVRRGPDGKYSNQAYVDSVLKHKDALRSEMGLA